MGVDPYAGASSASTFGRKSRIITPSTDDIDPIVKAIVCLTAGNVTVVPVANSDDDALLFVNVPAGYVVPFQVRRVTAATAIVATIED